MEIPQIVRPLRQGDMPTVKAIIDSCGLFPSDLLDGMTAAYFGAEASEDIWITYEGGTPVAVAYCAPERMTTGTWNLLLIAVHRDCQGNGCGTAIMKHLEHLLTARGERVLLVETSGLPAFEKTRKFYKTLGYEEEARIRDFYQAGEDKIIFRKSL